MLRNLVVFFVCCIGAFNGLKSKAVIRSGGSLQLGDNIAGESTAKILSIKYGIPYYCLNFFGVDLLMLDIHEQKWSKNFSERPVVHVVTDDDVIKNKDKDVILMTDIRTRIDYVSPEELAVLKKNICLKEEPLVEKLPSDVITVGVHIRKGNGGGQYYDGEQTSLQLFDFDRSKVHYRVDYENFPFDWSSYQRKDGKFVKDSEAQRKGATTAVDKVGDWQTKFPPDQFYIDQIKKLSHAVGGKPLFVIICTDDKNPEELVQKIQHMVAGKNVVLSYKNDRDLPFKERMKRDLYLLSHCDVLIRSQSYFSRVAELMGNHKLVMYPLNFRWEGNKLIMHDVVIKGLIKALPNMQSDNFIRMNVL